MKKTELKNSLMDATMNFYPTKAKIAHVLPLIFALACSGCASTGSDEPVHERTLSDAAESADLTAVREILKKSKTDVNAKDNVGKTPLMYAAESGNPYIVAALLEAGAAVNAGDSGRDTALYFASAYGRSEVVKLLLSANADPNAEDDVGLTPLIIPCRKGYTDVAKLLLNAGADPNAGRGVGGDTCLILASSFGHRDLVEVLVAAGANVNKKRRDGSTALTLAAQQSYPEIVKILRHAGAKGRLPKPPSGSNTVRTHTCSGPIVVTEKGFAGCR